jgi:biopolymer transport protein ExbD
MNLFIALIPMMLLSAVFLEMAVIKMVLPSGDPAAAETPREEPLALTVYILDSGYAVEARGFPRRVIARAGDGLEAELASVLGAFAEAHPENKDVVIGSGPKVRYQELIGVMDLTRDAGIPNVSFLGTGTL